ncbi:hypothetical protein AVEN_221929-1 [Araneus ventricosus]|uniref:ATP-dependent DNA helicase n=1 Tax=Araneus ventricosus TaxID=182803 RepID=A0A4Y2FAL4_ARAVE|nr:hypothetical protein AVEN_221929-1 [Araneus ventricosus]
MTGGRTAHSMLQIPIDLIHNEIPVCNFKKESAKADVLQEAKVLFWDDISMMHKHGVEAVNRTLQDLRRNEDLMGGLIVVLVGDFRQSLPVIPRGTVADKIKACLKSSYLWKQVKIMKLTTNMRIQNNCQNSQRFSDYLPKSFDGQEATTENGKIRLSNEFCKICPTLENLINQVYPDITLNIQNINWFQERVILTPLNEKVREINFTLQEKFQLLQEHTTQ